MLHMASFKRCSSQEKKGNNTMNSTIVGRCVNNAHIQNFIRNHTFGPEKLFSLPHHVPADELIASLLPGQNNLPMLVWDFQNEQTALIVIEISHVWVGATLERDLRIIYIHPDLEALFLQEVGSKLHDIPIGENEKNASSLEGLDDDDL